MIFDLIFGLLYPASKDCSRSRSRYQPHNTLTNRGLQVMYVCIHTIDWPEALLDTTRQTHIEFHKHFSDTICLGITYPYPYIYPYTNIHTHDPFLVMTLIDALNIARRNGCHIALHDLSLR